MQFTIIAIAAFTAAVSAMPTGPSFGDVSINSASVKSCAANTKTSCCDVTSVSSGILGNVLGGSCSLSNFNIPIIAAGGISGPQCNNGNTFCCPTNQNGNINPTLSCIPITL